MQSGRVWGKALKKRYVKWCNLVGFVGTFWRNGMSNDAIWWGLGGHFEETVCQIMQSVGVLWKILNKRYVKWCNLVEFGGKYWRNCMSNCLFIYLLLIVYCLFPSNTCMVTDEDRVHEDRVGRKRVGMEKPIVVVNLTWITVKCINDRLSERPCLTQDTLYKWSISNKTKHTLIWFC